MNNAKIEKILKVSPFFRLLWLWNGQFVLMRVTEKKLISPMPWGSMIPVCSCGSKF